MILQRKFLGLLATTVTVAGCSLINQFDEVDTTPEGSGDSSEGGATGDGDPSGDGDDTETADGGRSSGGQDGMGGDDDGSGGAKQSSGGSGSGGSPPEFDPGLIVVLPQIDGTETASLYAISAQSGKVLHQMEQEDYEVHFAVFEPARQIWFLNLDGKITSATFNRGSNEWDLGDEGAETAAIIDPYLVFALPDRLVAYEDGGFAVYDTSDLSDIVKIDSFDAPPGSLWGVTSVEKSEGGDIQYLAKHCATSSDTECPLELTRISIQGSDVQVIAPTTVATIDNSASSAARGNIRYDRLTRKLVLIIPNKLGQAGNASVDQWTSVHAHDEAEETLFAIPAGNSQIFSTLAIDPCLSVTYAMINNDTSLFAVPLSVSEDAIVAKQGVIVQGYGIAYEHFTRSILTTQNNATDGGIDTWTIEGDELVPEVVKRNKGWTREALRPRMIAVEEPAVLECE